MGVIPAGNGTDPWTMLMKHVQGQRQSADAFNRASTSLVRQDMNDRSAMQRAQLNADASMSRAMMLEQGRDARLAARLEAQGAKGSSAIGKKAINEFVNTLRENGVNNPYALAAIAAHIDAESGGNFGAFVDNDNGDGPSGGGLQWHDSLKDGSRRYSNMVAFAQKAGLPPNSPRAQALYFLQEGNTTESNNFKRLMNAQSLDDANNAMTAIQRYDQKKLPQESARRRQLTYAWGRTLAGEKPPSAKELKQQELEAGTQRTVLANGDGVDENDPHTYVREGRKYRVFYPKANYIDQEVRNARRRNEPWRYERAFDIAPDDKGNIAWRLWMDPPGSSIASNSTGGMGGGGEGGSQNLQPVKPDVKSVAAASVTRVTGLPPDEMQADDTLEQDENE